MTPTWISEDKNWIVQFSANSQTYFVYYKRKLFAKKDRKKDVIPYLGENHNYVYV